MTVATLRIELRVVPCASPREKHRQMRAILETLHRHFNVSVAEAEGGTPDRAILVAAAVARSRRDARDVLARVAEAVAAHPRAQILHETITEA